MNPATPTEATQTDVRAGSALVTDPRSADSQPDTPWWREAVIYQVYIRSFADSDGDGVGDLAGIRSRLPYLAELGVDAVWITPFYPSPMVDGGYDVSDYRDVEPIFGTLADTDKLVADAHDLGLRIIIDLVPNHTSDRHPWFQAALASKPGSPERARYLFRRGRGPGGSEPPNDWVSVFGGPAWERLPDGDWYLHLFAPEQPDLDWTNPEVVAEFESILRFWLDRGVDGFRIDVAHGLAKDPELPNVGPNVEAVLEPTKRIDHPHWDRDELHDVYRGWHRVLEEYEDRDPMLVGEAWVASPERLARYVRSDELHTAFNFDFLKAEWDATTLRNVIDRNIEAMRSVGAPTTWVLSNHDVQRHVTRYGGGTVGLRRARAAALLMLALPGGAYVYQGEELGLPEVLDLPDEVLQDPAWERSEHTSRGRDGARVPIPWDGTRPPFGFSPFDDSRAAQSWLPMPAEWADRTVAAQTGDPYSMLELYRSALRIRKEHPALGDGTMTWLDFAEGVLAFSRQPGFVCVVNLGTEPVELSTYGEITLVSSPLDGSMLPPDTAAWLTSG